MNPIALARQYRPKTFDALIGQDHVTQALKNSLTRNRLHHAYLFTGTRGVGKTSIARLFAKALNCETGITPLPCLKCDSCRAIEEARHIDLIEIDAASKTRVEDTRELLDNVMYTPSQGRFKVYLIDEVHMLSTHSFNALLKTLEEPPEHVVFLLATTDVHKLPMTVLSRCLQFQLNALPESIIETQLATILNQEKITFEAAALPLIATAADGSMRDALSLLDQIIATADNGINLSLVKTTLGHTQADYARIILEALIQNTPEKLLEVSQAIAKEGGQYAYVLNALLSDLHQISILQMLPKEAPLKSLSEQLSPELTQLFYQIALKGQEELSLSPTRAIGFEMTLLRMYAFKPQDHARTPILHRASTPEKKTTPQQKTPPKPQAAKPPESPTHTKASSWAAIIPQLKLTGLTLNAAKQADLVLNEEGLATLHFEKNHRSLFTPGVLKKLEEALQVYYKKAIKLTLKSDDATPNTPAEKQRAEAKKAQDLNDAFLAEDKAFQALKKTFTPS